MYKGDVHHPHRQAQLEGRGGSTDTLLAATLVPPPGYTRLSPCACSSLAQPFGNPLIGPPGP